MVKKEKGKGRNGDDEQETFSDISSNMSEGESDVDSDLDEEDEEFVKLPEEIKNKVREYYQITKELTTNFKKRKELDEEIKELKEKKLAGKISEVEFQSEKDNLLEKHKDYIELVKRTKQLQEEFEAFEKEEKKELEKLKPGVKPSDFKKNKKSSLSKILAQKDEKTKSLTSEQLLKTKIQSLQDQVKFESQKAQNYLKQITKLTSELDSVNLDLKDQEKKIHNLVKVLKLLRKNEEHN